MLQKNSFLHLRQAGFTLIELVVVIVIIGILAVVAVPRFNDKSFAERGFRDGVYAAVTHAKHLAIASRRFTCVTVTSGTGPGANVSINRDVRPPDSLTDIDQCTTAMPLPASASGCAQTNQVCAPSGVTLGGTSIFYFDPRGRVVQKTSPRSLGGAVTITISNQTSVTVTPETGYVQ